MKKSVLVFVFDGFADWEISHAMVGIRKSDSYAIKTLAYAKSPVTSMGGLQVLPDIDFIPEVDLADIDDTNTAMLILPGGSVWEQRKDHAIVNLVNHCVQKSILVASICGSTIMLADLGLLNTILHTSNDLEYLKFLSPGYLGSEYYRSYETVLDHGIITAGGTSGVDFARTIFEALDIDTNEDVTSWFQYFSTIKVFG